MTINYDCCASNRTVMPFLWCNTQTLHWLNTFKLDPKLEIKVVQMGTLQCSLDIFFSIVSIIIVVAQDADCIRNFEFKCERHYTTYIWYKRCIKLIFARFLPSNSHSHFMCLRSNSCVFFSSRCILVVETLWIYWTAIFGRPIPIKRIYCSNIAIHGRETESQRKAEHIFIVIFEEKSVFIPGAFILATVICRHIQMWYSIEAIFVYFRLGITPRFIQEQMYFYVVHTTE